MPRSENPPRSKAAAPSLGRARAGERLTADLTEQIRKGALAPGALVQSGPELAKQYELSYQTVVRALNELVEGGWLVRQQGRGTFVAPHPPLASEKKESGRSDVLLALDPRSLARGRFGFAIVETLDETLSRAGLRVRYAPLSSAGEAALLDELGNAKTRGVDFLIAFDRAKFLGRALARCPGLPALALHDAPPAPAAGGRFDALLIDDRPGGYHAGEELVRAGLKTLAYLGGPQDDTRALGRGEGFRAGLAQHGLKPAAEIWSDGWDEEAGRKAGRELLDKLGAPLGVFCANDRLAAGLYDAAAQKGLRIPQDVSVVGFDDQEVARTLTPPLSTMRIDRAEYGRQAAKLVLERLAQPGQPSRSLLFPVELLRRGSVREP